MSFSKKNIFISLILLYSFLGFFLLPYLLKPQLISIIEQNTKAQVSVENISFNPFVFSLDFSHVMFKDRASKKLLSFESLYINVDPSSLFYGALHLKKVTLLEPKLFVTYNHDKTLNLLNILKPQETEVKKSQEDVQIPRVIIEKIAVEKGFCEYKDFTRQEIFTFHLKDIGFALKNIDTANIKTKQASIRLYTTLGDGGFVDFKSQIHSLEPFVLSGTVEFEASKLYTEWKYLKEALNLEVADGKISFNAAYTFNSAALEKTKIENLNLSLEKLRIIPKNGYKDVLNLQKLAIENVTIEPFMQKVYVKNISLNGLDIQAKRSKDMSIDWLKFIQTKSDKSIKKQTALKQEVSPWNVDIKDVSLEKISLHFVDEGMKEALATNVDDISLYAHNIALKDSKSLILNDANMSIKDFLVTKRAKQEKLVHFKNLETSGFHLESATKSINIQKVVLDKLAINVQKYKNTTLNIDSLLASKNTKKVSKNTQKKGKPYHVFLKEFFLENAALTFKDSSIKKTPTQKIDKFNLHFYGIDSNKKTWSTYKGTLRLNKNAHFYVSGKLRHTPLKQVGKFELKTLDLKFLNPYLDKYSYLKLSDGKVSFKGTSRYAPSAKSADLHLKSSFHLRSLTLNDVREKTPLLFLNDLKTNTITLELFPNRLYIDEVSLKDFYVDAVIDKNKTMNFAKLTKNTDEHTVPPKEQDSKEVFPLKILKVNVASGSAKFSDYSIPIKFSTYIHNLDGVIYAISNTQSETTYVNIAGEVDEYGSAKLEGSIESANPKAYTDLNLNFQNLELNSLSGYSASFAGHEIDSGKLYLDLGYDILDSEMKGSNSIILKKVVLGKEVEDENVTVLPLGFVLGLLEDSDGVVDIDMPVEGNVDDPDFKYGTLVLKTIGGLITKAVTSPFKFLGAAMGFDAEKLEYLNFEAGSSVISPPEREKLDQIAKMMLKKPKINLKLSSPYDPVVDKQALQLNKLIDLVMQKSGLKNRKEHETAMTIDLLEDIYEELKDDATLEKIKKQLHEQYGDEKFERMYHNKLIVLCREIQVVSDQELTELAKKRSENIYNYLSKDKSIDTKRLAIQTIQTVQTKANEPIALHIQIEIK